MAESINIQKSILKGCLVFERSLGYQIYQLFLIAYWLLCYWLILLFMSFPGSPFTGYGLMVTIVGLLFMIWLTRGLYFLNKLTKVTGYDISTNKAIIIDILNRKYPKPDREFPNLEIDDKTPGILTITQDSGLVCLGSEVTVLFEASELYINRKTLGRFNIALPFYSVKNHKKCKKMGLEFEALMEESKANKDEANKITTSNNT